MDGSDTLTTVVSDTPHYSPADAPQGNVIVPTSQTPLRLRFTGNAPLQAQVLAAFRYTRVKNAINSFAEGMDIQLRIMNRNRWTGGLHRELVCLSNIPLDTGLYIVIYNSLHYVRPLGLLSCEDAQAEHSFPRKSLPSMNGSISTGHI